MIWKDGPVNISAGIAQRLAGGVRGKLLSRKNLKHFSMHGAANLRSSDGSLPK
jgi:hypothetical protein